MSIDVVLSAPTTVNDLLRTVSATVSLNVDAQTMIVAKLSSVRFDRDGFIFYDKVELQRQIADSNLRAAVHQKIKETIKSTILDVK